MPRVISNSTGPSQQAIRPDRISKRAAAAWRAAMLDGQRRPRHASTWNARENIRKQAGGPAPGLIAASSEDPRLPVKIMLPAVNQLGCIFTEHWQPAAMHVVRWHVKLQYRHCSELPVDPCRGSLLDCPSTAAGPDTQNTCRTPAMTPFCAFPGATVPAASSATAACP